MELANIFPTKYVKAADLHGSEVTVVIDRSEIETIGDDKKLVLYFQGKQKGLVTNRTNADRIAHLYGTNTDNWPGCEIVLFCDMVNFQGKVVEAVRVRAPVRRSNVQTSPRAMAAHPLPGDGIGVPMSNGRRSAPDEPPPHDDSEVPF